MLLPYRGYSNSRRDPAIERPPEALLNLATPGDASAKLSKNLQRSRRPYWMLVPYSGHEAVCS